MRLASFQTERGASWGVVRDAALVDLGPVLGGELADWLSPASIAGIAARSAALPADIPLADLRWLPPVPRPEKIICIGVNYARRNAEYRDGSEEPDYPSVFMRAPDSLAAHGQALLRPPESPQLDYEGEIVLVIGSRAHRVVREQAMEHVAGLSIMNEGTIRDWVRHAKFNVTQGKNFRHSGAVGPWLVTADEFGGFDDLRLSTRVNGELRQHDSTANLMFPFDYLVSYLSTFFVLKPGDLIATGTPNGAGARFDPPRYLVPGDVVEVEVGGIGVLRNTVADERP